MEYLDEREREKQQAILLERRLVNETLSQQTRQPKNNALGKGDPLDLDLCGPSSLQIFSGEDLDHNERKKSQQVQLQQWCSEGEKDAKSKIEKGKEEEAKYSKYILEEDRIRCEIADEEEKHRRQMEISLMIDNKRLAEESKKRRDEFERNEKQLDDEETKGIIASPFYCEDTNYSKSAVSDHRFRPDHFKGFTSVTLKSIIDANESVVSEKIAMREELERREQIWAEKQKDMAAQMEEAEREKIQLQEQENKIQEKTLMKQREELREKQLQMERDRFGSIGNGFFQKFGTSCR